MTSLEKQQKHQIHELPSVLIDKIAAGEVIENPASVIKELIENALDAKSTRIQVHLKKGGFNLIEVIDNGQGIESNDLQLACTRHATSKIESFEDMYALQTMGFRGEALASICACSKVTITTKAHLLEADQPGVQYDAQDHSFQPKARAQGTTIKVEHLFYNVPARKKFQKSAASSLTEITRIILKLALVRPDVEFQLLAEGKECLFLPIQPQHDHKQSRAFFQRVKESLPSLFTENSLTIDTNIEHGHISAVLASPDNAKRSRRSQYVYINHRAVDYYLLSNVVKEAFGTVIDEIFHPAFVIHLTINKDLCDVNIHPQKKLVKLACEREILESIRLAIMAVVMQPNKTPDVDHKPLKALFSQFDDHYTTNNQSELVNDFESDIKELPKEPVDQMQLEQFVTILLQQKEMVFVSLESFQSVLPGVVSGLSGMVLCDLNAIQKRLFYDEALTRLENNKQDPMQKLLLPILVQLPQDQCMLIEEKKDILLSLGIEVGRFGDDTIAIDALSSLIDSSQIDSLLQDIVDQSRDTRSSHDYKNLSLLATKYVRYESNVSQEHLTKQLVCLMKSSNPYFSPKLEPTFALVTQKHLKTMMKQK